MASQGEANSKGYQKARLRNLIGRIACECELQPGTADFPLTQAGAKTARATEVPAVEQAKSVEPAPPLQSIDEHVRHRPGDYKGEPY
jgi:hypothetical protein